jgi:Protein of unknown function (DUF1648)
MARTWHKTLILLMWLALPASVWMYWSAWDRLPARMAVHFDSNWQPNGYTSREGAVQAGIGILLVMLALFTVTTLIIDALKPQAFWPALAISLVGLGFCVYGNYSIVNFNLQGLHSKWVQEEKLDRRERRRTAEAENGLELAKATPSPWSHARAEN